MPTLRLSTASICSLLALFHSAEERPQQQTVQVSAGANLQALVTANPPGTVFRLAAGEYRLQQVRPKHGDEFVGEPGAVLNGSRLLRFFKREGGYWVAEGQSQQGFVHRGAVCVPEHPRCQYPEDLYIDDKPLLHVSRLGDVAPGKWFFDYEADRIYFADDPAGHKVETSVSPAAFFGAATGVSIRGLTVEKYASPPQFGAIGGQHPGTEWTIENNRVRLNHGTGIAVSGGSVVRSNYVFDNGQKGLGGSGPGILIDGNEIAGHTNWAGCDPAWESGPTKFALTTDLVLRNNYIHDNGGTGLWTDIDNIGTLIEKNRIVNNTGNGIAHEISYRAVIRDNVVANNGSGSARWLWGSQILIQNSQDVDVYGNSVEVAAEYGNGIGLIQQNRGTGAYGPYLTRNNRVHGNTIVYRRGPQGLSGAVADYEQQSLLASGNIFDGNTYRMTDPTARHWRWGDATLNWTDLRARGIEQNGTLRVSESVGAGRMPHPRRTAP